MGFNQDPTATIASVEKTTTKQKTEHGVNVTLNIDQDGVIEDRDFFDDPQLLSLEIVRMRAKARRKLAWTAMITMVLTTVVLFSPLIDDNRVSAMDDLLGLFYIAQASVVGAYMGVEAWMSKH